MPYLLLFLILGYPIAEIYATLQLVHSIGGLLTLLWLASAFTLGILMLRHHKLAVMATLFGDLRSGTITPRSLFILARYYLAAVLFIIPGPISDVIALILLLPWGGHMINTKPVDESILEGEYRRVDSKQDDNLIH
ncbi:MAG: FxsA family protein [Formivibrio sp.]|nr:FxsA family protein [Formivibrio sp.]